MCGSGTTEVHSRLAAWLADNLDVLRSSNASVAQRGLPLALDRRGAQDHERLLMQSGAVQVLRKASSLVARAEQALVRALQDSDASTRPCLERWVHVQQVAARDWNAAVAQTDGSAQMRQLPPLTAVLPRATHRTNVQVVAT